MDKLNMADEEYYVSAEYVLKLANSAYDLFKSSEVHEKRQILKMLLQNLRLKGETVDYDLLNPFDKIFFFASRQQWLPLKDAFLNHELEFDHGLDQTRVFFELLGIVPSATLQNAYIPA